MSINIPPGKTQEPARLSEVLAAFSLATDLGAGKSMGHAARACIIGMRTAAEMALPDSSRSDLYYSFLLMHSGCTALSLGLAPVVQGDELAAIGDITLRDDASPAALLEWMRAYVAPGAPLPERLLRMAAMMLQPGAAAENVRGACEVAMQVARRLGMPPGVQEAVRCYLERWDGKGPNGLSGGAIPLNARLLHAALKAEACHAARGRLEAETFLVEHKGKIFDPQVVDAFLSASRRPMFWNNLALEDAWQVLIDMEPVAPQRLLDEARLDDAALAAADFVDLKLPRAAGHSRETARIAEGIARRLGLPDGEVSHIRRAALVHDLGHIALPSRLLEGSARLDEADKEKFRLHPYYTERVLGRVPALAGVAATAGRHHEHLDGTGFFRGLSAGDLPVSARVLALADAFQDRLRPAPGRPEPDPKAVLAEMQPEVGAHFAPDCFEALRQELGAGPLRPLPRREFPAGLTAREVEVLRWVATGASNRQVARQLVVAEKTVAHHLEHIYNKIGVSSRAAAVFFAMEHELLA